jgi:putative hydrolase of HD superfamily
MAIQFMEQRLNEQFRFLLEVDKLKNVLRQNVLSDQSRRENSAEHSWHLALIALCLEEYAEGSIDLFKVTKMLLVHDVIEIDAGDAFVHTAHEEKNQRDKEVAAAKRIFALLPADQGAAFRALWEEFESGSSPEARFARVIDRVQPVLLHEATGAVIWRKYGTTHAQILRKLKFIETDAPKLWPRIQRVIDDAVATGALARG